ncbi:hypothetical protein FRC06_000116 [Ceratobasidium sp. 370]|nr:hypothetical protein FRC06_000116 [Ceratobasidium sp. 370]
MPRPARRPAPIALPSCPMDTLWEVDESSPDIQVAPQRFTRPSSSSYFVKSTGPLRSIFEDGDDDDLNVSFPLPPVSLPSPVRRMFAIPRSKTVSSRQRPVCSPSPRTSSLYPRRAPAPAPFPRVPSPSVAPVTPPRRQRAEALRPVSPASSASSSDTEPPRTPPAASASLPAAGRKPAYILAPPPPAEWESAIDALFAFDYESDEDEFMPVQRSAPVPIPPRRAPPPPPPRSRARARSPESYLSYSPVSSPGPLSPSQLPMSPSFARALGSPGFMPTSPNSDHSHSSRPARPSRRVVAERATIPVELLLRS